MSRAPGPHRLIACIGALGLIATLITPAFAADPKPGTDARLRADRPAWDERVGDPATTGGATELVIRFRAGTTATKRIAATSLRGVRRLADRPAARLALVETTDVQAASATLRADPAVLRVSVNHRSFRDLDPTDETYFRELWGLNNTGQPLYLGESGTEGLADADIDSVEALRLTTGDPSVVVAVIDDGVDFSHPDLAARAWTNPGEWGGGKDTNGVDDDGNGYIDDVHGWDFCHNDNTVHDLDDDFHGTHVAGTIAASLDGHGVVGVAPSVRIMALKFIHNENDCGSDLQAAAAIDYAASFGVRIVNASWGRGGVPHEDSELYHAIADHSSSMLFVASAGNTTHNNDGPSPAVPASYDLPNIISIAALDNDGGIAGFSNYGAHSVDIAAPGVAILSTLPADSIDPQPGWGWLNGTSMAAPHVTGVAALIASYAPGLAADPVALRARLMATGKAMPATVGLTVTGRTVDAYRALDTLGPIALPPSGATFVKGSILGSTTVSTRVGWPAATDDLTGISAYGVGLKVDGGAWRTFVSSTKARTADRVLKFGHAYTFRVRARDGAKNWGPLAVGPLLVPKLFQETSTGLTYRGGWRTSKSATASGGKSKYATRKGASATFTFTGRAYALVAAKSSGRGKFNLYVDGVFKSTVDLHRPKGIGRVVVAIGSWASSGSHTVKLVVAGTKGHGRVDVDAIAILR
jgi:subtilisin family serine protease